MTKSSEEQDSSGGGGGGPAVTDEERVVVSLMRAAQQAEDRWSAYLRSAAGISVSQYNVLRILRGARPAQLRVSEVRDRMIKKDSDITRLVDRLVQQGLVVRERDDGDRRAVLVAISYEGIALLERLRAPVAEHSRRTLGSLTKAQVRELEHLLDLVRGSQQSSRGGPPSAGLGRY